MQSPLSLHGFWTIDIHLLYLCLLCPATDGYLVGHCIDGRVLYPATGYLVLAWRSLARHLGHVWSDMAVCFEDVAIHRATIMPHTGGCMATLYC
jgi:hypothetical protein